MLMASSLHKYVDMVSLYQRNDHKLLVIGFQYEFHTL